MRCPHNGVRTKRTLLPDASADAVVSSLVLCSVADQGVVLAEALRVLRPGGIFAFYEHVRAGGRLLGRVEDLLTPVWGVVAGGCHPNRDTVASITTAGFEVESVRRFGFSVLPGVPDVAHVIGRARKS
ncbi:MAG: class I SAM-dependent methyltransferase [Kineosporiaceae bacterium]|nr:class I SAM-dependent methyltransferase [Aeromicrobium sp.]